MALVSSSLALLSFICDSWALDCIPGVLFILGKLPRVFFFKLLQEGNMLNKHVQYIEAAVEWQWIPLLARVVKVRMCSSHSPGHWSSSFACNAVKHDRFLFTL